MNYQERIKQLEEQKRELVEALQAACEVADCYEQFEKYSTRWRELLAKLGEEVPGRD